MKFTFCHNNINVFDLDKSLKFYKEALGLEEIKRKEAEDGSYIIVFLGDNTTTHKLELTWLRDWERPYNLGDCEFHLALRVDDYEKAYEFHKKNGWICYENTKMNLYFLEDPDGYWIEIVQLNRK